MTQLTDTPQKKSPKKRASDISKNEKSDIKEASKVPIETPSAPMPEPFPVPQSQINNDLNSIQTPMMSSMMENENDQTKIVEAKHTIKVNKIAIEA